MARRNPKARVKSMRKDAYDQLLMAIVTGRLEAGSSLDEQKLVKDFGLGRAAVRDALFRLSLEGLVERHARIGTRVADLSLRDLQNVFEARVVIESYAAALCAERAGAAEIKAIRETLAGHDEAIDANDLDALARMDRAFHAAIARASKNAEIEAILVRLHNNASRFWWFGIHRTSKQDLKAQGRRHLDIVDAIEARDFPAIEQAVRRVMGYNPDQRFLVFEPTVGLRLLHTAPVVSEAG